MRVPLGYLGVGPDDQVRERSKLHRIMHELSSGIHCVNGIGAIPDFLVLPEHGNVVPAE